MYKQSGFALIQLVIASIIATVVAVWGSQAFVNQLNDAKAQSAAQWMMAIQSGASNYLYKYSKEIKQASSYDALLHYGFQDWSSPSLNELDQAGFLSKNISKQHRLLGSAKVIIIKEGDCEVNSCVLDAIVVSDQPALKANGKIDLALVSQWLINTMGKGAVIYPESSNKIKGQLFEYNNPIANKPLLQVGTLALGLTNSVFSSDRFLTVKDDRDPEFQNNLSLGNNLSVGNNAYIQENINVQGDSSIDGNLFLNSSNQWLSSCNVPNAISKDSYYGVLICVAGAWQTVGRSPGAFSINSKHGCFNNSGLPTFNPVTGSCSCPEGYFAVQISEGRGELATDGVTFGYVCVL